MHTVFINTSRKIADSAHKVDILDIEREMCSFLEFQCSYVTWHSAENGYESCALKISDRINNYQNISGDYNLVIYVDLLDIRAYAELFSNSKNTDADRCASAQVLQQAVLHHISQTLGRELTELGCPPAETLVIFEQNALTPAGMERIGIQKREHILSLLGLPDKETLVEKAGGCAGAEIPVLLAQLKELLQPLLQEGWIPGFREYCRDAIDRMLSELLEFRSVDRAADLLIRLLEEAYETEKKTLRVCQWVTNRMAQGNSVRVRARHEFQLQLFLLECTRSGTTLRNRQEYLLGQPPQPKEVANLEGKWEAILSALCAKHATYKKKRRQMQDFSEKPSAQKLAPVIREFANERFGMDSFGCKNGELVVVDAPIPDADEKQPATSVSGAPAPLTGGPEKAVVLTESPIGPLFTQEEYASFQDDCGGDVYAAGKGKKSAGEYEQLALQMRRHHLNYLKKLKMHVTKVLSNYAGRSIENAAPLLSKRNVGTVEEDRHSKRRNDRYARASGKEETRQPEALKDVAQSAYNTAYAYFLEFCAGRSVAMTDIEETCNWFVTRIHQIQESLNKLYAVAIGSFLGLVALYLPFLVIQWEAVTRSAATLAVALGSIGVPLLVLLVVLGVVGIAQKRKFAKAWEEFKAQSKQVTADNDLVARKYDQLLSVFIPSLRWVYEYKLDVEFAAECCRLAKAKIQHHAQMMGTRAEGLGNLIEDLSDRRTDELYVGVDNNTADRLELDLNVPYCASEKNRDFYSIVDAQLLRTLFEQ